MGDSSAEDDDDLFGPRTVSYVEALLRGRMSEAEVEAIRSDLPGPISTETLNAAAAREMDDADEPTPEAGGERTILRGAMTAAEIEAIRAEIGADNDDDEPMTRIRHRVASRVEQLAHRLRDHDYVAALPLAEELLAEYPESLAAQRYVETARAKLDASYVALLGGEDRIPRVVVGTDALLTQELDRWSGFVLSLVDGASTVEDIIDVSGLPRLDSLRILHELGARGLVAMDSPESLRPASRRSGRP